MKTNKAVIAYLPEKAEIKALCGLSRRQASLHGLAVEDLAKSVQASSGIQGKRIVLALIGSNWFGRRAARQWRGRPLVLDSGPPSPSIYRNEPGDEDDASDSGI